MYNDRIDEDGHARPPAGVPSLGGEETAPPLLPAALKGKKLAENPASWGQAEKIIDHTLTETWEMITQGLCGLSTPRRIADALREAHLLIHEGDNAPGLRPPGLTDRDVARRLQFRVGQIMRLFDADAPDAVINKQIDMILEAAAWLRMEKRALAPGAKAEAQDWQEEN